MTAPAFGKSIARSGVRWLRELRHVPDTLAHQRRRTGARELLATLKPKRILFICHGNICRSPFAASLFERWLPPELAGRIEVGSAGFIGADRTPPLKAINAAWKHGLDLSQHRSSVVTSALLRDAELIVVMSSEQAQGIRARLRVNPIPVVVLGDLDPFPVERRTILDPWNGSDAVFDESYARLSRCVGELVRLISDASLGLGEATPVEFVGQSLEYAAEQQA